MGMGGIFDPENNYVHSIPKLNSRLLHLEQNELWPKKIALTLLHWSSSLIRQNIRRS